ncbi:DNA-binding protein [Pokkaliibacter sp. CJK22405]|uniref:DNA-binding protein n=1 Tax=Pokkaliibacter sp. CJK22405 TaxID=3384615 RepID=UPI003984673E
MSVKSVREQVFAVADDLLMSGSDPMPRLISARLPDIDEANVQSVLHDWWASLPQRIQYRMPISSDVPKEVVQVVQGLWDQAIRHASHQLEHEKKKMEQRLETAESDAEHNAERLRSDIAGRDVTIEQQKAKLDEFDQRCKNLQAELSMQKATLHAEIQKRNQAEEREKEIRAELDRTTRKRDESRATFEARLKEEQSRLVEIQAKFRNEISQMRSTHDQLRDESNKRDTAYMRQISDLQAEVSRGEVKIETLSNQVKSLEQELKGYRYESSNSSRELNKLNAQLLTEINRSKRFEHRINELESASKEVGKRVTTSTAETMRRESDLRQQVLEREDELQKLRAQLKQQQSVLISREEEMKRLQARLHA